jgi:5-deoxy-glucuronate isomerase
MPRLLVPAKPDADGVLHDITPESAGWSYVGFSTRKLGAGASASVATGEKEICLVVLSGRVRVSAEGFDSGIIGERADVFSGLPWSVYLPPRAQAKVAAEGEAEIALCSAPAAGKFPPRTIPPAAVETLTRGKGTNLRHIRNILSESSEAESLLVVEVITPSGHWSSYPPHKHDRDDLPRESLLEETYYHRLNPAQGFAFQRVYDDERSLDETMTVKDRDVVLVPRGYHPCAAPHGYELYYLNVMAGPKRVWRFYNDPAHEWLMA